jgi:hypothetical protein
MVDDQALSGSHWIAKIAAREPWCDPWRRSRGVATIEPALRERDIIPEGIATVQAALDGVMVPQDGEYAKPRGRKTDSPDPPRHEQRYGVMGWAAPAANDGMLGRRGTKHRSRCSPSSASRRTEIEAAIGYIANQNALGRMKYAEATKRHYPIGMGITEAAAKTIVVNCMRPTRTSLWTPRDHARPGYAPHSM